MMIWSCKMKLALAGAFLLLAPERIWSQSFEFILQDTELSTFSLSQPRPEICQDACAKDAKCNAFVYVKPGIQGAQAACWLILSASGVQNPATAGKGRANPLQVGIDRISLEGPTLVWDLLPAGSTAAACKALCDRDPRCKGWSFYKTGEDHPFYPSCDLKSEITKQVNDPCCVSGRKSGSMTQPTISSTQRQPPPTRQQPPSTACWVPKGVDSNGHWIPSERRILGTWQWGSGGEIRTMVKEADGSARYTSNVTPAAPQMMWAVESDPAAWFKFTAANAQGIYAFETAILMMSDDGGRLTRKDTGQVVAIKICP